MFGFNKNKVSSLHLLNCIENYPIGNWGAGEETSMAKFVLCAHIMGREYGMDVNMIKSKVVKCLGGYWKLSKLPGLYEALSILGVSNDWYNDYSKVELWRESHQYEILTLENLIKSL